MKRIILPIILAAFLLIPSTASADSRNSHRQSNRTENTNNGRGNSGNRGGNHRGGSDRNDRGNSHDKNHNNNKKDKYGHGNSHGHKPQTPPPGHRPGHGHGSSVTPPGHHSGPRPGYGNHHHPPRLAPMVKHCVGRGRYDHVWMVGPGQYAVRFFRNGYYYMQYIWPETGRYGSPFRIVMNGPGEWYAYNNRNQWYYEDGNTLRISLNGSPMTPWTLIPSVELNINL